MMMTQHVPDVVFAAFCSRFRHGWLWPGVPPVYDSMGKRSVEKPGFGLFRFVCVVHSMSIVLMSLGSPP